jgi:hypothetical protein
MSWKNTKKNNYNYFNGKPFSGSEENNLEVSKLIHLEDLNGDGYPFEFLLYGGEYFSCGHDERLVSGYDKDSLSVIVYKIADTKGKTTYWKDNFIPDKNGDVKVSWLCGDHGSETETNFYYQYNALKKLYILVREEKKQCP